MIDRLCWLPENPAASSVSKKFFDTLLQDFLNLISSKNLGLKAKDTPPGFLSQLFSFPPRNISELFDHF